MNHSEFQFYIHDIIEIIFWITIAISITSSFLSLYNSRVKMCAALQRLNIIRNITIENIDDYLDFNMVKPIKPRDDFFKFRSCAATVDPKIYLGEKCQNCKRLITVFKPLDFNSDGKS